MPRSLALVVLLFLSPAARAVDPADSFPPARHGKGDSTTISGFGRSARDGGGGRPERGQGEPTPPMVRIPR